MRYAIISDIHGNLLALEAALADARTQNVDQYLFLGDYYADFPYPNEVGERILSIPNALAVRGNKEDYLHVLSKEDPAAWTHDQLAGLHWNYHTFRPEILRSYMEMPATARVESPAGPIELMHSWRQLFPGTSVRLSSFEYSKRMRAHPFTREEYLSDAEETLCQDDVLSEIVSRLGSKIFLFGHSHVQWHAKAHGAYFINPGSCGLPLDCDVRPAYTILDIGERGGVSIDERRVTYDRRSVMEDVRRSEAYRVASVWFDIVLEQAETGFEQVRPFFILAGEIAERAGKPDQPYTNEIWNEAGRVWRERIEKEGRSM